MCCIPWNIFDESSTVAGDKTVVFEIHSSTTLFISIFIQDTKCCNVLVSWPRKCPEQMTSRIETRPNKSSRMYSDATTKNISVKRKCQEDIVLESRFLKHIYSLKTGAHTLNIYLALLMNHCDRFMRSPALSFPILFCWKVKKARKPIGILGTRITVINRSHFVRFETRHGTCTGVSYPTLKRSPRPRGDRAHRAEVTDTHLRA